MISESNTRIPIYDSTQFHILALGSLLVRNLNWFNSLKQSRGVSEIRPSPDPDTYPKEPDGADDARQPSDSSVSVLHRYRVVIAVFFILLIIAGSLSFYSTTFSSSHFLNTLATYGVLLALFLAGLILLLLVCDSVFGGIYTEIRIKRRRRESRTAQVRAERQHRRRVRPEAQESSRVPSLDQYETLPAWLLPLLKNRPVSLSLHDEITASATTTEEAETMLQTAIDDFTPEVTTVIVTIDEPESLHPTPSEKQNELDGNFAVEYPSEASVEREAILDLLGALELQHKEGRVTDAFYKRKRKQLLDRLNSLS